VLFGEPNGFVAKPYTIKQLRIACRMAGGSRRLWFIVAGKLFNEAHDPMAQSRLLDSPERLDQIQALS